MWSIGFSYQCPVASDRPKIINLDLRQRFMCLMSHQELELCLKMPLFQLRMNDHDVTLFAFFLWGFTKLSRHHKGINSRLVTALTGMTL